MSKLLLLKSSVVEKSMYGYQRNHQIILIHSHCHYESLIIMRIHNIIFLIRISCKVCSTLWCVRDISLRPNVSWGL